MKKLLIGLLLAGIHFSASAGNSTGPITMLLVLEQILIFSNGVVSSPAPCVTNPNQWAIDISTAPGKAMYAFLLQSQAQGTPVTVVGYNDCLPGTARERPYYAVGSY